MVAQVEQFVELKAFLADSILLHVNLQPLRVLLQVGKSGLAHQANRHNASRNPHVDWRSREFFRSFFRIPGENLRNCVREIVFCRIRRLAERFNLLDLLQP